MVLLRFVFIIGLLAAVLYFSGQIQKGQKIEGLVVKYIPPSVTNLTAPLDNSGLTASVSSYLSQNLNLGNLKDLGQLGSAGLQNLIPKAQSLIENLSNFQSGQLYLKAPKSVFVNAEDKSSEDKEIRIQLGTFEVKDSRPDSTTWKLAIFIKDAGPLSEFMAKNYIGLSLSKNDIKSSSRSPEDLTITNGKEINVTPQNGKNRGEFSFNPVIVINLPKDTYLPPATVEIGSTVD
ncbi:MAG: hypothetical protein M1352_00135 [Patescibacteria group bacterium]|nr:hypothetical protein [Patescibacteria group bacterium]